MEAARAPRPRRRPPPRYSALALLRHGLSGQPVAARLAPTIRCGGSYDVVIIGGGVHGLAAAYYLAANHGITNVAVLDKGYIGGGGSGRSTAILRSNYLTPEGVRFYDRSMQLYRTLAADLDYNVMFSRRGHLTLAHNDSSLRTMRWRAEVNKLQGVDSEVIDPAEIKRLVPYLDTSAHTRYPILGALYHPPGGIIRHDAVDWGYARARRRLRRADPPGHRGHRHRRGRRPGARRAHQPRRHRHPGRAQRTAGWSTLVAALAGVRLPIQTFPLQAAVTEPVRPFLDSGGGVGHAARVREPDRPRRAGVRRQRRPVRLVLDPRLAGVRRGAGHPRHRAHARAVEDAPAAPVERPVRHDPGLLADHGAAPRWTASTWTSGWGTYGFKAGPVSGEAMAQCIATGTHPGDHRRLRARAGSATGRLVGEKGAAAVGH